MNLTSTYRLAQIRRRWKVVAVVMLLTVLAAAAFASTARTTYVGKSTLMLSGRTPEQDAVMVVGYLTLFNDPATIERLKAGNDIPEDVTAEARTAGASPILNIEAKASNPQIAQDAAEKMARTFSSDINSTQQKGKDQHLADLQGQLLGVEPLAPDGSANAFYSALTTQINEVKSDATNELLGLQLRAGVRELAPNRPLTIMAGAVGGLLLGMLAALGVGALSTRPANSADLRQRTGVEPLIEVPSARKNHSVGIRRDRLRALGNIISLDGPPAPSIVAVSDTRGGSQAREVADALAESSVRQGACTVLIYANNEAAPGVTGIGFNDALGNVGLIHELLRDTEHPLLKTVSVGSNIGDRYRLLTRDRMAAICDELRTVANRIIIVTPPIGDSMDAQTLCAVADATVLVVTRKKATFADVTSAADELKRAHARLLGAVLMDRSGGERRDVRPETASETKDKRRFENLREVPAAHAETIAQQAS
ncbi:hypothetical protein [Mycobacterium sp. 1274761.0]|uniref:hypothetical protein n=1 Tax=Mycobacterium sp. 1274761.0 TaxID=1834077 RepID=UPI0007FED659|nr:hypothetical protein [Mycobacterium sp. 1274761.0]OBK74414.1 hypothetical protein A5651_09890 [Mycobacterium sp. 1274761.0]